NVVHRDCDFSERKIIYHSDIRCQKISDLRENNKVSLLFYSPVTKIQLRIKAVCKVHYNNEITQIKWEKTQPRSKECYSQINPSGREITTPEPRIFDDLEAGYKNFSVIENKFDEIDCLILHHQGHKRYLYIWDNNNNLTIKEIAP
ncbi:MAG: pyridoxamine 5'-phosphate oxidase family protein, partial [Rickettsiales bacterium]|nr:pyridoxamine 5'-phosphate oxidase family protein [Rickettsiales bacterium]